MLQHHAVEEIPWGRAKASPPKAAEVTTPGERGDEAAGHGEEDERRGVRVEERVQTQRAPQWRDQAHLAHEKLSMILSFGELN